MKFLPYFIMLYLIGNLVFTTAALFDLYHEWDTGYYVWSSFAHGGLLAWLSIYFLVPPYMKKPIKWVTLFAVTLSTWEIISVLTNIPLNHPVAVLAVFLVLIVVISFFLFKGFPKIEKYVLPDQKI